MRGLVLTIAALTVSCADSRTANPDVMDGDGHGSKATTSESEASDEEATAAAAEEEPKPAIARDHGEASATLDASRSPSAAVANESGNLSAVDAGAAPDARSTSVAADDAPDGSGGESSEDRRCASDGTSDAFAAARKVGFDATKVECDDQMSHWLCGDFRLHFDARGCLSGFERTMSGEEELIARYEACLVRKLAGSCDACLADRVGRAYVSCTLL